MARASARQLRHVTALHEAAHAVVATRLGYVVTSINLKTPRTGYVMYRNVPVSGPRPLPIRPCPLELAVISLAGDAVEQRLGTYRRDQLMSSHVRELTRIGASRWAVFSVAAPAARRLVRRLWPEIERVASALEELRWPTSLRKRECRQLLEHS